MNIIVTDDYASMSRQAADVIAGCIAETPSCVLGLATGSTPIGLYRSLVERVRAGKLSFRDVTTFNLDEYRGLPATHEQSYRHFMQTHLFDHVDVNADATHVPDGANPSHEQVCAEYEQRISDAGGIDLQLLGLGHNGHIGFNEPDDHFAVNTHLVRLHERTIQANSRLFDHIDEVPREAYTMGVGTIMRAARILVVASGADKAQIVRDAFFGPVTPQVPASVLQLHPYVTVIVDEQAGALCV
ncbi:glucosamine-6-phosphate deaminase [Eggerthellaceae bacterium zg-1084]|uniref:Glucosamine-6-phosphate deaminase n=1 Tax=Berryella wangjianweii TaxID=2734634 RepID=A0A6M8J430_9ACTN|nr:glucosamine-6-phosphate deaminase [Berryella wangjianweii]NPD31485.1 glucosamine-6-phosphate deaminase [Berryella wangjianweii]NPD33015.1 glucosamine-6-phosphate deaminase [Eggerthellaceae bacterium zg-997]QKF07891.1 glucosamine-6-phosphate deaminase [Berryella wangjianweii]